MTQPDNGVYYFLGNITSHILHALPLYESIGGTFIVTSAKARLEVERLYNVPVINIDDKPYKWMMPGRRPKRIHHYITFGAELKKTYEFLNENAKVVIFYELFELCRPQWLTKPKKVFLTHGNMLKSYMTMYPKRLEIVKDYDYMAALGPHMKEQFIRDGIDSDKLIDIGIARTDKVLERSRATSIPAAIAAELKIDPAKKIVSYLPTFWGVSSVYTTGLEIMKHIPDDITLIFRPHPQTPERLLNQYKQVMKNNPGIIYAPEGRYKALGLLDILNMSNVIIGDVSSVMLEAILLRKPLIFAYDSPEGTQESEDYRSIREVVNYSQSITPDNAASIKEVIVASLEHGVDPAIWDAAIAYNFFDANGQSVSRIAHFIRSIIR